jgi:putative FmdB family regulatory protein
MIYDYKCQECGEVQEVEHKLNETPVEKCIKCGADPTKLQKQLSPSHKHVSWSIWNNMGK